MSSLVAETEHNKRNLIRKIMRVWQVSQIPAQNWYSELKSERKKIMGARVARPVYFWTKKWEEAPKNRC
jgi:hypothetical protein